MAKVRVLLADGQNLFREGVCALLGNCEDLEIVGQAADGSDAIEKVREQTPDVVLLNLAIPIMDCAEVIHRICKVNSKVKVLLLTQYEDKERVLRGLKAGASGCIPTRATASDLVSAILAVYQENYFLYPSVAKTMMEDYFQRIEQPGFSDPYDLLTPREKEVLKLIAEGRRSREIANLLVIAVKTALWHRASVMKKLGIHNQAELVKYALRRGVINLES